MCGCSPTKKPFSNTPTSTFSASGNYSRESIASAVQDTGDKNQMVTVQYVGPIAETFTIKSRTSRDISYRFGNNDNHRFRSVFLGDAEWLLGFTDSKGNPTYVIVGNVGKQEANDPALFVGNSIIADAS